MNVTSQVVKVGFANVKEAEKKLNEVLKDINKFINLKVVNNNGQHSSVIIFTGDTNKSIIPQVKIVEYSVTDTNKAKEQIDEALKGIDPINIDIASTIDGSRLIILYDIGQDPSNEETEDEEETKKE